MTDIISQLATSVVVPVIRTSREEDAITLVEWLAEAGIKIFEITNTTPNADKIIARFAKRDDLLIGAGTILDSDQAIQVFDAGSKFIVSPAFNAEVAQTCSDLSVPYLPGAVTPTEVLQAANSGAAVVKIFPASSCGGPSHIKALKAVFPGLSFMPTGGVSSSNVADYLKAGALCVGMGGNLVDLGAIERNDKDAILEAAKCLLDLIENLNQT